MQMSDEGKARFMVIPIVVMLAVTIVARWHHQEPIDVDEAYEELEVDHRENFVEERGLMDKYHEDETITAVTPVNNERH